MRQGRRCLTVRGTRPVHPHLGRVWRICSRATAARAPTTRTPAGSSIDSAKAADSDSATCGGRPEPPFAAAPSALIYGRTGTCTQQFGTLINILQRPLTNGNSGNLDPFPNGGFFDESRDYFYPLPIEDLQLNENLEQNPGWEQ